MCVIQGKQTGRIGEGGLSSWDVEDIEESEEDDVEMIADTNVKVVRETSHISKCLGHSSCLRCKVVQHSNISVMAVVAYITDVIIVGSRNVVKENTFQVRTR